MRLLQFALLGLCLAGLLAPALTWQQGGGVLESEQRARAPFPGRPADGKSLRAWPASFERYVQDRLGARTFAVDAYGKAMYFGLRTSPVDEVVPGRAGWLFYNPRYDTALRQDPISDARGTRPLARQDLEAYVKMLAEREQVVAGWGGRYLFVVAPNKSTIYPEFLPDTHAPVAEGDSPRRQLARRFGVFPDGPFLDLTPAMMRAKAEADRRGDTLYHRTDTHWNALGALAGLQEILAHVRLAYPELRMPDPADFTETNRTVTAGLDLARMMGIADAFADEVVAAKPRGDLALPAFQRELPVVLYRDSYFNAMSPYWELYLPQTLVEKTTIPFSEQELRQRKPALVIQLVVERRLRAPKTL